MFIISQEILYFVANEKFGPALGHSCIIFYLKIHLKDSFLRYIITRSQDSLEGFFLNFAEEPNIIKGQKWYIWNIRKSTSLDHMGNLGPFWGNIL